MTSRRLQDFRRVVLDASGRGQVSFGPQRSGTWWTIARVAVSVSTNTLEPTASIYRSVIEPSRLISSTFTGSRDADDGLNEDVYPGDQLIVQWTGGDVGATATVSFSGEEMSGIE